MRLARRNLFCDLQALPAALFGVLPGLRAGMFRFSNVVLALALWAAVPALAEDRVTLGWGRMFSNDALGDAKDRWRTGGYQVSRVRGYDWQGALPQTPGELLEFRAAAQIVAPADLVTRLDTDRRYATLLSFGMHTQFDWKGNDVSLGADVVITGPQTGISNFQSWVHNMLDLPKPRVVDTQIGDGVYPTLVAELGRRLPLGDRVTLRPFVEAQAGVETLLRIGGDVVVGTLGRDDLMVRDSITGQRYRAVDGTRDRSISLVLGGDYSEVFGSALLPDSGIAELSHQRARLRAGVHWQGEKASVFYGLTYLGKEFDQQSEGQLVGALNLSLNF
jgi:hypothetical protein